MEPGTGHLKKSTARIGKFLKKECRLVTGEGSGDGECVLNGYGVSFLGDENVLE